MFLFGFRFIMVLPTVLKKKHSLVNVDCVLQFVRRAKVLEPPKEFARPKADCPLEELSTDDLRRVFMEITGKELAEIADLLDWQVSPSNARLLVHLAICLANEMGQPRGQDLLVSIICVLILGESY